MRFGKFSLLISATLVACGAASAQSPTYHLGRTPSQEKIKAWDISVGPEGKELPLGSGTAADGAKVYAEKCAVCHGPTLTEGKFLHGVLVGGKGSLTTLEPVKTIGSYWPYATTIFDFINRAMPFSKPGSLTSDEVYAVTAFLLYRNEIIKETDVIDAKSLPKVQMPNRNGFFPVDPEWKDGFHQPYFSSQLEPRKRKP
jgi:S-disulfanyl-L-cysteine oxidoreductase SoxD